MASMYETSQSGLDYYRATLKTYIPADFFHQWIHKFTPLRRQGARISSSTLTPTGRALVSRCRIRLAVMRGRHTERWDISLLRTSSRPRNVAPASRMHSFGHTPSWMFNVQREVSIVAIKAPTPQDSSRLVL
ncbi:hypothetical protein C2E23DRAFT_809072 [Lenzites betulinus]|nr:hypothetical protein C2E23DRAFT_809072 [Lenzites betulinus]